MSEAAEVTLPAAPAALGERVNRVWIERPPLRSRLMHEGPLFLLASAVVAASFLLPTLQSHHAWISIPCLFKTVTHLPCMACGLTRSFVAVAHGNFLHGFEWHLLGPGMFLATCGFAAYFATSLVSAYRIRFTMSARARRIAFFSVLGLFVVCWVIKLAFMRAYW